MRGARSGHSAMPFRNSELFSRLTGNYREEWPIVLDCAHPIGKKSRFICILPFILLG